MQYVAIIALCLIALGIACVALGSRRPVKHAPCDCPGCEIFNRPRSLPLKPERDRLAKGGHRG